MQPEPVVQVIGCGAIARELLDVVKANSLSAMNVECLPARLHSTPHMIPDAVDQRISYWKGRVERVFVAYGDCGTGGELDAVLTKHDVERLPGAHCYEFFMGGPLFAAEHQAEPGTFYLTDYLARHFDRLVWSGLGLDRYPQLLDDYFGNYQRVLYVSQVQDRQLVEQARSHATRLGLEFEHRHVGLGDLAPALLELTGSAAMSGRLEVIYWRDIPAQVIGKSGRNVHRVSLTDRFQEAIDRAATRAGLIGTDEYLGEWRKERSDLAGDPAEVAIAAAEDMEETYSDELLEAYVKNLAWKP